MTQIESNVMSLRMQIEQLKKTESEMANEVQKQKLELQQLEAERERVAKENDTLNAHADKFTTEKELCEQEHHKAIEERKRLDIEQKQLVDKLNSLREQ